MNRQTIIPFKMASSISTVLKQAKALPITRGSWNVGDGLHHLTSIDERFTDIIVRHGVPSIYDVTSNRVESNIPDSSENSPFHSLLKTIIYQQLSGKSAEPIFKRFSAALGIAEDKFVEPDHILNAKIGITYVDGKKKITVNDKVSGLSEAKAKYIKDLAEHFSDESKLKDVDLALLSDDELFNKLVAVKGLGPWSVHMYMLFNLQRSNVLAPGDLGIRKGLSVFHGKSPTYFEGAAKQKEIIDVCAAWAPYSSLGCWYMWRLSEEIKPAGGKKKKATEEGSSVKSKNATVRKTSTAVQVDGEEEEREGGEESPLPSPPANMPEKKKRKTKK